MGDLARFSIHGEDRLYEIFGVDAEILIDHAWGYEPCGMAEIKSYKPSTNSISEGQVLSTDVYKRQLLRRGKTEKDLCSN